MKYLFFVALLALTSPAFAELCDDPHTQSDMNDCSKYHFTKFDNELNDVYGKLKAGYGRYPVHMAALVKSERAWVAFRNAECQQDAIAAEGGSAAAMILLDCKTRLTNTRIEQLRIRLECKEGDMSCVNIGDSAD